MQYTTWVVLIVTCLKVVSAQKPHIIIIVADDLGWGDVGFHGSVQIPTPNLDALAYDGVILNNYYVEQICTPSRAALMTGRYPIHTGLQTGVIYGSQPFGLGLNETLFPQYLKKLGYKTHMIGKWHLGFVAKEYTPPYRGFDTFLGFLGGKDDYWDHSRYEGTATPEESWGLDFYDGKVPKKDAFGRYSTDVYTERAAQLIRDHNTSEPFFLYYPQQAVHNANGNIPLEAPYEYMKRFSHIAHKGRRTYAAMLASLDDSIGNLTAELRDKGMLENSIIFFTTDNGGPAHGFSDNHASNFPLRGMKYTRWEGGVRGCSFLWSPLLKSTPRVSSVLMHIVDVLPSMLHAAGYGDLRDLRDLDGVDQWDALVDPDTRGHRTAALLGIDPRDHNGTWAVRLGDYKLIWTYTDRDGWYRPEEEEEEREVEEEKAVPASYTFPNPLDSVAGRAIRSINRGQYIASSKPLRIDCGPKPANASTNCQPYTHPCLFDIIKDPCEYNNMAAKEPELVQNMLALVEKYRRTMVPPRNKPFDPAGNPPHHGGIWGPWRDAREL